MMRAFSFVLVAAAALPARAEDLTIVKNVTAGKDKVVAATDYVSAERVRTSSGDSDTIVEHSTGKMTAIDHRKKQYYETSLAEMAAFFQRMDQQMEGSPLGGLLGAAAGSVRVEKGTGSRKVAGHDCDPYVLSLGEAMKFDVCAARELKMSERYFDAMKSPYAGMGPAGKNFEKMFEEMKKIKGYPLSVAMNAKMMMFKINTLSEATEVKKGPIPASAWEVPAGYKKVKSPFAK
jgi:hypothetical protein